MTYSRTEDAKTYQLTKTRLRKNFDVVLAEKSTFGRKVAEGLRQKSCNSNIYYEKCEIASNRSKISVFGAKISVNTLQ